MNAISKACMDALNRINETEKRVTPNIKTTLSNINYAFGRYPRIAAHAIRLVTSVNEDMRDLSIALDNELVDHAYDDDINYLGTTLKASEDLTIIIISKMFNLSLKHSAFRVKWNYEIPDWALESHENFMLFDEAFNFDNTDTIEQLKERGCK